MKSLNSIDFTTNNNLCIGCGVCSVVCPENCINMNWTSERMYLPQIDEKKCTNCGACLNVCPNSKQNLVNCATNVFTEKEIYGIHDKNYNYYIAYDKNVNERIESTSGGITTKLLKHLLETKKIDCVISVTNVKSKIGESHYSAIICNNVEMVDNCRSSAYGSVRFDIALKEIFEKNLNCAITALPCLTRSLKKLPRKYQDRIKYIFGIICSHNVSAQFIDFMAYSHKINKKEKFNINLRDKKGGISDANNFNTSIKVNNLKLVRTNRFSNPFTVTWRNYWFAYNGCLYCPDFYANEADFSVKDAWGRLSKDPLGISLCVVRNNELNEELQKLEKQEQIYLEPCDNKEIYNSQTITAIYKQKDFLHRWFHKPLLKNSVFEIDANFKENKEIVKDYNSKLKTLKYTTSIFKNSNKLGFLILKIYLKIKNRITKKTKSKPKVQRKNKIMSLIKRLAGKFIRLFGKRNSLAKKYLFENKKTFSVLISGGYGYQNTGDEAQLGANLKRWKTINPNIEITVLSPNPTYTAQHHNIRSIYAPRVTLFDMLKNSNYGSSSKYFKKQFYKVKRRLILTAYFMRAGIPVMFTHPKETELLHEIIKADVLHISGGGFLTGMTLSRLWDNALLMRLAYILGTPYILTGQTIGVFQNNENRKLAKWGLDNAKFINLRDNKLSENEIKELNLKCKNVKSVFDDALFCDKFDDKQISEIIENHNFNENTKYVAVNYHFWGMDAETKQKATKRFAELCMFIKDNYNLELFLIPMVPSDTNALNELNIELNNSARLLNYNFDYKIVRGVIAKSEFVFTMKHHPIIFAQGEGVPQISIALDDYYYRKNTGAMANCGHEKYCLRKEIFYSQQAETTINELFNKKEILKQEIENWLNSVKEMDLGQLKEIF